MRRKKEKKKENKTLRKKKFSGSQLAGVDSLDYRSTPRSGVLSCGCHHGDARDLEDYTPLFSFSSKRGKGQNA